MKLIFESIRLKNAKWKFNIIKKYLTDNEEILDFGCGEMLLSKEIVSHFRKSKIVGVDVINIRSEIQNNNLSFVKYDGKKIPFPNKTFDTTIAFYVLHHCWDPEALIRECARVTKKKILIIESIPHSSLELPFMRFFDWFFNIVKFDNTPLPYKFYTVKKWKKIFEKSGFACKNIFHPKGYEDFLPLGKMYVLEFIRK